jgi:hypothetical protein
MRHQGGDASLLTLLYGAVVINTVVRLSTAGTCRSVQRRWSGGESLHGYAVSNVAGQVSAGKTHLISQDSR